MNFLFNIDILCFVRLNQQCFIFSCMKYLFIFHFCFSAVPGSKGDKTKNISNQQSRVLENKNPPLEIPDGLTAEEIKRFKKKSKKDRQRHRKQIEKKNEEQETQMQQLQLQKQQELLRQQEEQIQKQKLALQCQQEALMRQQNQKQSNTINNSSSNNNSNNISNNSNNNNSKKNKKNKKDNKNSGKTVSAVVYDGDDMAKNFNLPPGVSINKVAGQPGMVTISNNSGGGFSQPFLPNPNVYSNSIPNSLPVHSGGIGNDSGIPTMYSNISKKGQGFQQWSGSDDKCSSYPSQDNVIVVDTINNSNNVKPNLNPNSNSRSNGNGSSNSPNKREMSSDEKVQAAVNGLIDPNNLNKTQKKKFKKMKKAIQEEKEKAVQKQKEEDDLMDQMYLLSRANKNKSSAEETKSTKNNNSKKNATKQKETKISPQSSNNNITASNISSNNTSTKNMQNKNSKNQSKNTDSLQNKIKATSESGKGNNNAGKQNKNKDNENKSIEGKKNLSQEKNSSKNSQSMKSFNSLGKNQGNQQLHQETNNQNKNDKSKSSQAQQKINNKSNKATSNFSKIYDQQYSSNESQLFQNKNKYIKNNIKENISTKNFGPSIGFASEEVGHEARYAQYLAANANTLANVKYNSRNGLEGRFENLRREEYGKPVMVEDDKKYSNSSKKGKGKKRGKKGTLEDLNTIDSVFTPKDVADGELDETERDVEAFKRFCFYNVARHSGEKPKVNFNIKDIMIKKKPCNGNL